MSKQSSKTVNLPVKKEAEVKYVDVAEKLAEYKEVENMKFDQLEEQIDRVDTWVSVKDDAKDFLEESISKDEIDGYIDMLLEVCGKMREAVQNMTEEDITGERFIDPYKHLFKSPRQCKTLRQIFEQYLIYNLVIPYGMQAERLFLATREALGPIPKDGTD